MKILFAFKFYCSPKKIICFLFYHSATVTSLLKYKESILTRRYPKSSMLHPGECAQNVSQHTTLPKLSTWPSMVPSLQIQSSSASYLWGLSRTFRYSCTTSHFLATLSSICESGRPGVAQ